jgi:hypothetical protein
MQMSQRGWDFEKNTQEEKHYMRLSVESFVSSSWLKTVGACLVLLPTLLGTMVLSRHNDAVSAQTAPVTLNIMVKEKRFGDYQKTFVEFAQSNEGSMAEYEVAMDLQATSTITGDYLMAVGTLLEIYGDLSCEEDRAKVRPTIEREIAYYSKQIEPSITGANLSIAHTHMPGVAAEGTRMRDDLREIKSIFDSIKIR